MNRTPIEQGHPLFSSIVGQVKVHNTAGECAVRLTEQAKEYFSQAEDGHYMLCLAGVDGQGVEDAVASVTVRDGQAKLYSERLVPDMGMGEHDMVVSSVFTTPKPSKSAKP